MDKSNLLNNNSPTEYEVKEVVGDYGVYAHYKHPQPHSELLLICNSRHNALLIKDIMDCDKKCIAYEAPCRDDEDELDTANGNIVGYLDDLFHAKEMHILDNGYDSLDIILRGVGRMAQLTENEMRAISEMKATQEVNITRKFLGKTLWKVEL